jgi:orotidine-5'-phosphate decarboxylase
VGLGRTIVPTDLIAVLDVNTQQEALHIVNQCEGCDWFKVGSQLFTNNGPPVVKSLQDLGKKVMLDLKFHDIPNTVHHSAAAAANMAVNMFTLHAGGGPDMIAEARRVVDGTPTKILAVTVLTSMTEATWKDSIGIPETPAQTVVRWAKMAVDAGAHGIVCSPREIEIVRGVIGDESLIVTPGIRPEWSTKDDQARIMTPQQAAEAGATHIVVGRPILNHENPAEAVKLIREEIHSECIG